MIVTISMFCAVSALTACQSAALPSVDLNNSVERPAHDLQLLYARLHDEGARNAVLNHMRIGVAAMKKNSYDESRQAFDKALLGIETLYANNESAAKARSLWYEEGMKDFKGEPYERVMAFYYRGLLFLKDGDYENARAAFKSAIIQDAFKEEEQNRCNFALVLFLEGLASQLAGDTEMAKTSYRELSVWRPDFKPPVTANLLIIAETGTSPRKVADGPGHAELKYRRGRNFTERLSEVLVDGKQTIELYPMEDIYMQSTTRGTRQIDKILQGKVAFQQTNLKIGSTLTEVSSIATMLSPLSNASGTIQIASGALGLLGAVQMYVASNAKPHADTRYWDNLPDTVHVKAATLPPGNHLITFRYVDKDENYIDELEKTIPVEIRNNSLALAWDKTR